MRSFAAVAVDPAPGAHLTTSPAVLTVTFDHPIDPTSLGLSDIQLDEVDNSGDLTSIDDATEAVGPRDDQLILTPGQPLSPGHYEIFLAGNSGLLSTDEENLTGLPLDGSNQALGDFWIAAPGGVGLGDAIDLGTPGSTPTSTSGALDFQVNPYDVALYKITLPEGYFWRLGLEVSAQRDGSSLDSALALFDDQGRPIATDEFGRRDAPDDPFLFAGLQPGTYYVGVSGIGNLPGAPGGYDLVTRSAGAVPQTQAGGPFTLNIVADPEDSPTQLLSFAVDQADPLDPQPTGLTLGFSGTINVVGPASGINDAIEVVDQAGHTWPVAFANYNESEARISYLFRQPLPEGVYTVRLPAQGGLVDLAGLTPVAPGEPDGVLGTFTVGPSQPRSDPTDLGALLPDAALAGVPIDVALAPGASVSYRVVLTFPSFYQFQGQYSGGALAITRIGPDGIVPLDPGSPDAIGGSNDAALQPGVYSIQLSAIGADPVNARYVLKALLIQSPLADMPEPDWPFLNGIGQGPALSLRLVQPPMTTSPAASAPLQPTTSPAASAPLQPTTSPVASAPPQPTTSPAASAPPQPLRSTAQQVPSGLILGLGGDFVGRPSPFDQIVGPATSGTSASASDGIGLQLRIVPGFNPPGNPPVDGPIFRRVYHEEGDVIPVPPADDVRITDLGLDNKQRVGLTRLADVGMNRLRDVIVGWVERGSRYVPSDVVAALSHARAQAISAESGPIQGHARQVPFHIKPAWIALASALAVQFRHQISRTFVRALSWNPVRHLGRQPVRRASLPVSPRTQGNWLDSRSEGSGTGDVMPP
ncbi:MAG: pre-peptidase C-terminal domain-containing protein [Planctomycetaceae bacterium]|nr:pre-peptidase C-terminal domain-containing protein [Planctomycetaceae bacterium]